MTINELVQDPQVRAAAIMIGSVAALGLGALFFSTRNPCPGCGRQRKTFKRETVLCMTNKGGVAQWVASDIYVTRCNTIGCKTAPIERPIPRPASDEEVVAHLLS
jgi:hypothetical protein